MATVRAEARRRWPRARWASPAGRSRRTCYTATREKAGDAQALRVSAQSVRAGATVSMTRQDISGGVVHDIPEDLRNALASDAAALAAWEALTPLARNEWICWTISVKKPETRREHVERARAELKEGVRRPCCWYGCVHRTDKPVSPSVQYVLSKRSKRSS